MIFVFYVLAKSSKTNNKLLISSLKKLLTIADAIDLKAFLKIKMRWKLLFTRQRHAMFAKKQ
jgi:hypothetical protein